MRRGRGGCSRRGCSQGGCSLGGCSQRGWTNPGALRRIVTTRPPGAVSGKSNRAEGATHAKNLVIILGLAAVGASRFLIRATGPVNEMGLSIGHMHVMPPDRDKEAKAWLALGGQMENNLSNNIPVGFPGIIILIGNARATSLGSAGTVIDHVGFRVADLQSSMNKWKGVQTWWKNGTWFSSIEPGPKEGQAFLTTPGGIKIEVLEDKTLKVPIVFDHVHYYMDEARLKPMEDFWVKMFGAKAVKGEAGYFHHAWGKADFRESRDRSSSNRWSIARPHWFQYAECGCAGGIRQGSGREGG